MTTNTAATTTTADEDVLDDDVLIPLLARRSYHLPGNTWCADWRQWFGNNHLLFGICLHHAKHPVEWWERLLALAASVSFGLIATNVVYELSMWHTETFETNLVTLFDVRVSQGRVLWTLPGICHSIFDMVVWNIMACACCHPGGRFGDEPKSSRCRDVGSYLLTPVILGLLGLAVYMTLFRASRGLDEANGDDDYYKVNVNDIEGIESFSFLLRFGIDLLMTWCVYFPLLGTILFSGIFGCNGLLPIVGGRPRDIRIIQQEQLEEEESSRYAKISV